MSDRIFVVDDDASIRELLSCMLQSYKYEVEIFESGEELFKALSTKTPSLFILDIMLPGIGGIEILKRIRGNPITSVTPVIMLTAKSSEVEKVTGLDSGANDYITKPFGMLELMARVRSALRSKSTVDSSVLVCGSIILDNLKHSVTANEMRVELTLKEYDLLKMLMQNADNVVERDKLLNEVWGYNFSGETRTLDVHIRSLRSKLNDNGDQPKCIETVRGVGYKINS